MITMWTLYLLNVVFNLASVCFVLVLISGGVIFLALLSYGPACDFGGSSFDKYNNFVKKYIKYPITVLIVSVFLQVIIPTKKEALAIYMIPKVVNNEQLQQLPDNALKYLNILFKKEMEEIQKEIGGSK